MQSFSVLFLVLACVSFGISRHNLSACLCRFEVLASYAIRQTPEPIVDHSREIPEILLSFSASGEVVWWLLLMVGWC